MKLTPGFQRVFELTLANPPLRNGVTHRGTAGAAAFDDGVKGVRSAMVIPNTMSEVIFLAGKEWKKRHGSTQGKPALGGNAGDEGEHSVAP